MITPFCAGLGKARSEEASDSTSDTVWHSSWEVTYAERLVHKGLQSVGRAAHGATGAA